MEHPKMCDCWPFPNHNMCMRGRFKIWFFFGINTSKIKLKVPLLQWNYTIFQFLHLWMEVVACCGSIHRARASPEVAAGEPTTTLDGWSPAYTRFVFSQQCPKNNYQPGEDGFETWCSFQDIRFDWASGANLIDLWYNLKLDLKCLKTGIPLA